MKNFVQLSSAVIHHKMSYKFRTIVLVYFVIPWLMTCQPMTTDREPVTGLVWSSFLGGQGGDNALLIQRDGAGHIYLAGWTDSTDFPRQGAIQTALDEPKDIFITKLSPDGETILYSTYLGGNGSDSARGMVVDEAGQVILVGVTRSTDFPTTLDAVQPEFGGGEVDGFITILNAAGNGVLYSSYLGGSQDDFANDMARDEAGNIFLTGSSYSDDFPTTANALQPRSQGSLDAFVMQLSPGAKQIRYSTYLGGSFIDSAWNIVVDQYGDVYLSGLTESDDFPVVNPLQADHQGDYPDIFFAKLVDNGQRLAYSSYLGGNSIEDIDSGAMAVDDDLNLYLAGSTESPEFPVQQAIQGEFDELQDVFISKITPDGQELAFSTFLGGVDVDGAYGLTLDSAGNIYVIGFARSDNFPLVNAFQPHKGGGDFDIFVVKLPADGRRLFYSSFLGGTDMDIGWDIVADDSGYAYIAGQSWSTNFPIATKLQPEHQGSRDGIVSKLNFLHIDRALQHQITGSATYVLTVTNSGLVTPTNLQISHTLPPTISHLHGGQYQAGTVRWSAASLSPGQSLTVSLTTQQPFASRAYQVQTAEGYQASGAVLEPHLPPVPPVADAVTVPGWGQVPLSQLFGGGMLMIVFFGLVGFSIRWYRRQQTVRQNLRNQVNPYISGAAIEDRQLFFGRETFIKRLLESVADNHVAIEGWRRSGKSSLLKRLASRLAETNDPRYHFIPVLFDCQRVTEATFYARLMRAILRSLEQHYTTFTPPRLLYHQSAEEYDDHDFEDDWHALLEVLQPRFEKAIRLIVLLDEGDHLNHYQTTTRSKLRGLLSDNRTLRLVWAGVQLVSQADQIDSPWYNQFISYKIPPLTPHEARQLIVVPAQAVGYQFEVAAIETIIEQAQGQPYIIQYLCQRAVAQMLRRQQSPAQVTSADVAVAIDHLAVEPAGLDPYSVVYQLREERKRGRME